MLIFSIQQKRKIIESNKIVYNLVVPICLVEKNINTDNLASNDFTIRIIQQSISRV